jgi:hypothetical protein
MDTTLKEPERVAYMFGIGGYNNGCGICGERKKPQDNPLVEWHTVSTPTAHRSCYIAISGVERPIIVRIRELFENHRCNPWENAVHAQAIDAVQLSLGYMLNLDQHSLADLKEAFETRGVKAVNEAFKEYQIKQKLKEEHLKKLAKIRAE